MLWILVFVLGLREGPGHRLRLLGSSEKSGVL